MVGRALTPQEEELVNGIAETADLDEASKIAGYDDTRNLYNATRRKPVQRALFEGREARIKGDLAALASKTLKDLMQSGSDAVKAKVAIWTLEAAGHGKKAESEQDKPLGEMSPEELERFIGKQQELISGYLDAVPMKVATPHNGAQQIIPAPRHPKK